MDVTLLAIHLDEASFSANAPFAGESDAESSGSTSGAGEDDSSGSGKGPLPAVVALIALVAVAAAVRKLRGGGSDEGAEATTAPETEVTP